MTNNLTKHDKDLLFKEFEEYLKKKSEKTFSIPSSIFSKKLSPLESIVKYLIEAQSLNYSEIGRLLKKDRQVIWTTYQRASKKLRKKFKITSSEISIPISNLSSDKYSISELIVAYLKSLNMKNTKIANVLKKDQRTVWTWYKRYKEKHG